MGETSIETITHFSVEYRPKHARMVELVDTRDLKSLGYCSCAGSSPAPSNFFSIDEI